MVSDSLLESRPMAGADSGQSSGSGGLPQSGHPLPGSPFAAAFAGWIALSDIVDDSNPELGDAMRALAMVLRAAVEQSTVEVFPEIRNSLESIGIPTWCIDDAERGLLSDLIPLRVEALSEDAAEAFAAFGQSGTLGVIRPSETQFMASVVHYGAHGVLGLSSGEVAPLPQLPVRGEYIRGELAAHFLPSTSFRVVASLDLPAVASGRGFSIWCNRPIRRRGDTLLASEHTYIGRDRVGLTNPHFLGDAVTSQYRADIGDALPNDFSESIDLGRQVDQYYYFYELADPKRSRAVRKLRAILESNRSQIQQMLSAATSAGVTLAEGVAASFGVPVPVITPLLGPLGGMIWNSLLSHLQRSLADTNMTPWGITHTVLFPDEYQIPLSMFILQSPVVPTAKLHMIRRDEADPDASTMSLGYGEKKRAFQQGRGMVGLSQPPRRPCPADLWKQVADANQPVAWTEPQQDQSGFRVLVPHAEAGDECAYVSALRADVLLEP